MRYHQIMVADAPRNRAFHRALARLVRPDATVMDLGAGTGLWAVLAARLGARRVIAVEKEPMLVPVIERLARENGVHDRVTVVAGDSRHLDLPRTVDLLVSETVGTEGFDEDIVAILADARRRFLRPRAAVVPCRLTLMVAPAEDPGLGIRPRLISDLTLRELGVHVPGALPASAFRLSGRPAALLSVPLATLAPPPALTGLSTAFRVADGRRLGCFVLWSELDLAPGIRLRTRDTAAWTVVYFPVEPAGRGPCAGRFELDLGTDHHRWRVVLRRGREEEVRDYGPLLAWGALQSWSKRL